MRDPLGRTAGAKVKNILQDVIAGLGGNNTLRKGGGKDRLCGEGGKNTLKGGSAVDRLDGSPGSVKLGAKAVPSDV